MNESENLQPSFPITENNDKIDFVTGIYIPYEKNKECYEVKLDPNEIQLSLEKLLDSKIIWKEFLGKKDESSISFGAIKDYSVIDKEAMYNHKSARILFSGKKFLGDCVFVRYVPCGERGIPKSITLEQYKRFDEIMSRKDFKYYDFQYSILSGKRDIISAIVDRCSFQYKDEWLYNKPPNMILNEYLDYKYEPIAYIAIYPNGPFACYGYIPGTDKIIYSKIYPQKNKSLTELSHKMLQYYVEKQNELLFGDKFNFIYNDKDIFENEKNEYFKLHPPVDKDYVPVETKTKSTQPPPPPQAPKSKPPINEIQIEQKEIYEKTNNVKLQDNEIWKVKSIETAKKIPFKLPDNHIVHILTEDKKLVKHIISQGNNTPMDIFNNITAKYAIYIHDYQLVLENNIVNKPLLELDLIEAIKIGFLTMSQGEECVLNCDPKYGYGELGLPGIIPPNLNVIIHLHLQQVIERKKPSAAKLLSMSVQEKIQYSQETRDKARDIFKSNRFCKALGLYKTVVDYLDINYMDKNISQEDWDLVQEHSVIIFNNISLCYYSISNYEKSAEYSEKSLQFFDTTKALNCLAKSNYHLKEFDLAIEYMKKAKELDKTLPIPLISDKDYSNFLLQCTEQSKIQKEKEERIYAMVFDKLNDFEDGTFTSK